ncbi:hypothetical protein CORC01_10175 [Colletotrichum orchidophilum]|uniref:Impact N-terminal domain-containing protein n=1 Tax=Colletotrichum orchidophilum TaxID=1209926 RepID=A0A1G4AZR4_9PEZI|nr:uncharacterized protein CORC01_10175 [Colletotrichum orchidophilum]OHE94542.1 hypothetical protein CORC01_10175 [Colletotrichum orchidophilum]
MASQKDLQELLRVITSRKGVSMMAAMGQVKALQAVELRSTQQISDASLDLIERGLGDAKTAKALQTACKTHLKRASTKRSGNHLASTSEKRPKNYHHSDEFEGPAQRAEEDIEASLSLPIVVNEEEIAGVSIYTNRAPLMLAFVLELLRYTMPVQPLSSRLSLAQAVVSANSKSKAISIGLAKATNEENSWGEGQPKVNIMGRAIAVLKRGDYSLQGSELAAPEAENAPDDILQALKPPTSSRQFHGGVASTASPWSVSRQVTFKSSTFVARVANISNSTEASGLVRSLLLSEPQLQTATHNVWAYRVRRQGQGEQGGQDKGLGEVWEASEDDGETGCGEFIQRLIREAGITDVVVVLNRWFGGEMLGPDRWRLVRNVVTEALSQRLRLPLNHKGCDDVALWALDLQNANGGSGLRSANEPSLNVVGVSIYRPESARAYLLRSFGGIPAVDHSGGSASKAKQKRVSKSEDEAERMRNLGCLLGALRLLFGSWSNLGPHEMNRKAFTWYASVRPDVQPGVAGWGAKGGLKLDSILQLRRDHTDSTKK